MNFRPATSDTEVVYVQELRNIEIELKFGNFRLDRSRRRRKEEIKPENAEENSGSKIKTI